MSLFTLKRPSNFVLGMNRRNHHYIGKYNQRKRYPLVDDKLLCRTVAEKADLKMTPLIGVIAYQHEVKQIEKMVKNSPGFVIKPAKGSGGKGILVITEIKSFSDNTTYYKPSGEVQTPKDLKNHLSNILAGLYSLGGNMDKAIVESLILADPCFQNFSYEGVPDIRIIVFQGFPIMAMVRLSTKASDGKANLHQGAVGVGLNIQTGKALKAVQFNHPLTHHPDTRQELSQLTIPQWDTFLSMAARCYEITGLGYLGVDMVLDKNAGPLILEINARPGLAIQIANGDGLLNRLHKIEKNVSPAPLPPQKRVVIAKDLFGS